MNQNQGCKANACGNALEQIVLGTFTQKGFIEVLYPKWVKNPEKYGDEILIRNYPYQSIYNCRGNTEFCLISKKYNCRIRIECKWQQVAGSVDEKYPYLYLNCIEVMPEKDIIILLDGNGYKEGAKNWLVDAIKNRRYQNNTDKNIQLFNITEFMTWVNNNFHNLGVKNDT